MGHVDGKSVFVQKFTKDSSKALPPPQREKREKATGGPRVVASRKSCVSIGIEALNLHQQKDHDSLKAQVLDSICLAIKCF